MSVLKNDFFSEFSELFVHYISIVIPQETETIFPFFFSVLFSVMKFIAVLFVSARLLE